MQASIDQNGFVPLPQIWDKPFCAELASRLRERLSALVKTHNCKTDAEYFSIINRWPLRNILDKKYVLQIINNLQTKIYTIFQENFEVFEIDLLYKSPWAPLATPVHQDISYVWQKPYAFSTWIALTPITAQDSALQFLPGSHKDPILPAIDFWQPDFIDTLRLSPRWQQNAITIPVNAGDGFLFSSRLLHASQAQQSDQERLAIVIRWGNRNSLNTAVPSPFEVPFGMWNCGKITEQFLQTGLQKIYGLQTHDMRMAIIKWLEQLENHLLTFSCDTKLAIPALKKLQLLHDAYHAYRGGDSQGIIYRQVWKTFLLDLKNTGL